MDNTGGYISFKGKLKNVFYIDDSLAYRGVAVKKNISKHDYVAPKGKHVQQHSYSNYNGFDHMLRCAAHDVIGSACMLKLGQLPSGVEVVEGTFLSEVRIYLNVSFWR